MRARARASRTPPVHPNSRFTEDAVRYYNDTIYWNILKVGGEWNVKVRPASGCSSLSLVRCAEKLTYRLARRPTSQTGMILPPVLLDV